MRRRQFDWLELPDPPATGAGGQGVPAGRGAGALRAVARGAGRVDRPAAPDRRAPPGLRRAGRADPAWRFDRMATVCHPAAGRVTASFAAVAKHYGVSVAICPARRGNRKGVVEKANHTAAQRWWRTLADDASPSSRPRPAGPVVRCCAATPGCARPRRQGHRGHRRRGRAADAGAGAVPGRPGRRAGRLARRRWSPSAATATRCHPSWPAPRSRSSHRLGAPHIELATSGRDRHRPPPPRAGRGRRHRPRHRARPGPGTRRACPRSPPPRRTDASSASHPARPPEPPPQPCAPAAPTTSTVHTRHPTSSAAAARSWSTSPATPPQPREGTPSDEHTDHDPHQHRHTALIEPNTPAAGQPLPAATRPPRRAQAAHRRRTPARRPRPAAAEKLSLTAPWNAFSPSKSTPPRPAGWPAGCASPRRSGADRPAGLGTRGRESIVPGLGQRQLSLRRPGRAPRRAVGGGVQLEHHQVAA